MKIALFAGTFNPPTLGHQEIIERSAALFGKLYVGVATNESKDHSAISLKDKISLLKMMIKSLKNVEVVSISGLVVDFAKKHHVDVLVRGVRNSQDLDFEMQMEFANRLMTGIETICLLSSPKHSRINSTLIREIASHGRRLEGFVPAEIEETVFELLSSRNKNHR